MKQVKNAVLLVNLGTPDSTKVSDVRKYLFEFLNDARVIDIPYVLRKILVNGIIVPFRAPKSAKAYRELWTDKGSPLLYYTQDLANKLDEKLEEKAKVFMAMRYQNPSLKSVLEEVRKYNPDKLIIIPLYPQNASSTTSSTIERIFELLKKWYVFPEITIINQFYEEDGYLDTIVERAKKYNLSEYDHILFSYHGLPVRQVDKVYDEGICDEKHCETEITDENKFCYKANCYATTRYLAQKLELKEEDYTVAFQSRLDKNWLEPFSDKVIIEKAKEGAKKILVFSPAFVADCLETNVEIGVEYQELFEEHGGEKVQLVESLNDHPLWVNTLKKMVEKRL